MYEVLDLYAQLNSQLPGFEIKEKIILGEKNNVLNKLVKIFDIPINLGNIINLVEYIDRNLSKRAHIYQQQANWYD